MSKITDVIIVKYNLEAYEAECVVSVLENTEDRKTPYHLTIYDNYEKDENLSVVWNRLIKNSTADYIMLLNNDTLVKPYWLKKMLQATRQKKFGAVGAISNKAGRHQGGWEKSPHNEIVQCTMLSGFAVLFPKKVWEELGGFDERFKLYGEDSDFFTRMREKYNLYTHYGVHIFHYKAKSTEEAEKRGKDIKAIQRESANLYQKKLRKTL